MHDLSSAFLTAVGYVIDLATRNKDADFHEHFASGALGRMGLKARLGFLQRCHLRPLDIQALKPFLVCSELRPDQRYRNPHCPQSLVSRSVSPRAERNLLPTLALSGKAVHE